MTPVRIAEANLVLAPPKDFELECSPLHVRMCTVGGEDAMCSTWEPNAEELAELNKGGKVLLIIFGNRHPAVGLNVERAIASTEPAPGPQVCLGCGVHEGELHSSTCPLRYDDPITRS